VATFERGGGAGASCQAKNQHRQKERETLGAGEWGARRQGCEGVFSLGRTNWGGGPREETREMLGVTAWRCEGMICASRAERPPCAEKGTQSVEIVIKRQWRGGKDAYPREEDNSVASSRVNEKNSTPNGADSADSALGPEDHRVQQTWREQSYRWQNDDGNREERNFL